MAPIVTQICEIVIAIILPPLAVFLVLGCGPDVILNIILTFFLYIPGVIHAVMIIRDPTGVSIERH